jgi:DNA-binding CsgD family transcriptional regulator
MTDGMSDNEIADLLCMSTSTVQTHIDNMKRKLEATNRAHLVAIAVKTRPPQC